MSTSFDTSKMDTNATFSTPINSPKAVECPNAKRKTTVISRLPLSEATSEVKRKLFFDASVDVSSLAAALKS